MSLFLSKSEQGIVVFHVWKNLSYEVRISLSLILIFSGLFLQVWYVNLWYGIIQVLAGNLLLLVKGYDNRIKLGTFSPESEWVNTDREHLEKLVDLNSRLRRWDTSAMDITNGVGVLVFFLILLAAVVFMAFNPFYLPMYAILFLCNAVALILPHWITGVKQITTIPGVIRKIKIFTGTTDEFKTYLQKATVSYLILLKGSKQKLPSDVKMKIKFPGQPEDFLGFYAQVAMNTVQGQDYPYFYVVLVAKSETGKMAKRLNDLDMQDNVIQEYKVDDGNEILVIRQYTTNKSGYYTNPDAIRAVFLTGIRAYLLIYGDNQAV